MVLVLIELFRCYMQPEVYHLKENCFETVQLVYLDASYLSVVRITVIEVVVELRAQDNTYDE